MDSTKSSRDSNREPTSLLPLTPPVPASRGESFASASVERQQKLRIVGAGLVLLAGILNLIGRIILWSSDKGFDSRNMMTDYPSLWERVWIPLIFILAVIVLASLLLVASRANKPRYILFLTFLAGVSIITSIAYYLSVEINLKVHVALTFFVVSLVYLVSFFSAAVIGISGLVLLGKSLSSKFKQSEKLPA